MPMEPQSGRGSQSTSNIYHHHNDLHKMQQWQSRSLKFNVFLYLEGFRYMFPMKAALGMKLPLRGFSREEQGLWSLAALLKTPFLHFKADSLCITEAESQGFISPLCSLPLSFLVPYRAQGNSFSSTGQSEPIMLMTAQNGSLSPAK